ncbi:MAG: DUF4358 domain-containing protein [Lawsonibacter sp.]
MRKKEWKALLLSVCVGLLLVSCGSAEKEQPAEFSVELVQDLADAGAFSEELEPLDGDTAFALYRLGDYGLEREALTDCAVLRSSGATCEEAAVLQLELDSEEDAQQVEQALKDYLQSQIDSNRGYRPMEIPKLEDALVERQGNSFLLVVANDLSVVQSVLET